MLHRASAVLDAAGYPLAIHHRVVSPSHLLYVFPRGIFPDHKDWSQPIAPPPQYDPMAVEGLLNALYDIPNQKIEQHYYDSKIPISVWRTTGHGPNNFVLESFIDELAAAAARDPLEYRRALLRGNDRALKVLALSSRVSVPSSPGTRPATSDAARGHGSLPGVMRPLDQDCREIASSAIRSAIIDHSIRPSILGERLRNIANVIPAVIPGCDVVAGLVRASATGTMHCIVSIAASTSSL
jgi:hypothetical protein